MPRKPIKKAAIVTPAQAAGCLLQAVKARVSADLRELLCVVDDHDLLAEVNRRCEEDPNGFPGILWDQVAEHITLSEETLRERCEPLVEFSRRLIFCQPDMEAWNLAFADLKNLLQSDFNLHS